MKKRYYCFHCQREVATYWLLLYRVCSRCGRKIYDNGERFYKVCDKCKANLPPDAAVCIKCSYHFSGDNAIRVYEDSKRRYGKGRQTPDNSSDGDSDDGDSRFKGNVFFGALIAPLFFLLVCVLICRLLGLILFYTVVK